MKIEYREQQTIFSKSPLFLSAEKFPHTSINWKKSGNFKIKIVIVPYFFNNFFSQSDSKRCWLVLAPYFLSLKVKYGIYQYLYMSSSHVQYYILMSLGNDFSMLVTFCFILICWYITYLYVFSFVVVSPYRLLFFFLICFIFFKHNTISCTSLLYFAFKIGVYKPALVWIF